MHHGKQGGLGRTRSQEMHTFEEQSWFSPTWKLILWQERLNLPETRTATDHKGLHRFQRKDVWKLLQTPSSKAKTHHDNTNHSRCARCGGKSVTLVAPAISVNICQYPSMSPTMSYHVLPWSWHAGTIAPLNFSQLLYVLCLATAAPVIWKDPWWTKPTDHNGQYTQSTPGNTFQRSAAGAKASENGLKIAVILDDTMPHCTRKLHDKRWRVTSPQSACKPICAHNISQ